MSRLRALLAQRLRRDRVQLLLWIIGTALLAYATYTGVTQSYATEQQRSSLLAAAIANPVILLFRGLPSGSDQGAFMLFLIFPFLAMLAAFMSSFLAVRHTRGDEEVGRAELVAATEAGRTLPLVATMLHGILANVALAALTTVALLGTGLPLTGSLIAGTAAGAVGVAFLGIGLVAAQLMRTSRGANSLAVWVLMITFVVAGVGNAIGTPSDDLQRMESSWLTWLSPFGWGEQTRPFADDNPWPIVLCAGFGMLLAAVAIALQSVRDLGASFIPERPGRRDARASLTGPFALAWRLTWPSILGWAVGGLLTGTLATSLASVIDDIGAQNPAVASIIRELAGGADVQKGTIVVFFTVLGILAACGAVQTVCRARQEETHGTAELVLSDAVGRVRWLASFAVTAFLGILLVAAAGVAGAALGLASRNGGGSLMGDVVVTASGQVVAASVFGVLTALIFVLAPRLTIPLGWTLLLVGMVLGLFGPLFGFPDWVVNLSPFGVTPSPAADGIDVKGLWWLVLVVAVGGAASLTLMRRRELASDG